MHRIKLSEYTVGIKFDKDSLAVEQNNYATKVVNAHMFDDLRTWPKNSLNNFKLKNCLVGATNIVKKSYKEKWVYSGYGIIFDRAGSWNFGPWRLCSKCCNFWCWWLSSHTDNCKNNFLVLRDEPTSSNNGSFGSP